MPKDNAVGIVVVAHSRKLAEELIRFASIMKAHDFALVNAAGPGQDSDEFGTNAILIQEAIVAADRGGGVVVLADIGSAVMSVQAALELLPAATRAELVDSPLVEGTVAAVAANQEGATFEQVKRAALSARDYRKL